MRTVGASGHLPDSHADAAVNDGYPDEPEHVVGCLVGGITAGLLDLEEDGNVEHRVVVVYRELNPIGYFLGNYGHHDA